MLKAFLFWIPIKLSLIIVFNMSTIYVYIHNYVSTDESRRFLSDQTIETYVRNSSFIPKYFKKTPIGVFNPIPSILLASLFLRFLNLNDACIKVTEINNRMNRLIQSDILIDNFVTRSIAKEILLRHKIIVYVPPIDNNRLNNTRRIEFIL